MAITIGKRRLQRREAILLACAGFVAIFVLYSMLSGPLEAYRRSGDQVQQARARLAQVQVWSQDIKRAQAENAALMQQLRKNPVNLFSAVNQTVNELGLEGRCDIRQERGSDASSMTMVKVDLQGINLDELVTFLHRLNDGGVAVALYQMSGLSPSIGGKGLDLDLTLVAPRPT